MRKSLWNAESREELLRRLESVEPGTPAVWGKMNAPQMIAHLLKWMEMIDGTVITAPRNLPIRYPGIKQLLIYVLPFPKGLPTASELVSKGPTDWETDYSALRNHIEAFGKLDRKKLPAHPAFGTLTPEAWGVLGYRHTDHHLRQFGV